MPVGEDRPHASTRDAVALMEREFSRRGSRSPRRPEPRKAGRRAATSRPSICSAVTIMGTKTDKLDRQQLRPDHEIGNLWVAGPGLFPDRRRLEPDLYDLSRCRCGEPSISPPAGAASPDESKRRSRIHGRGATPERGTRSRATSHAPRGLPVRYDCQADVAVKLEWLMLSFWMSQQSVGPRK